jgi:hypothetical protein
MSESYILPGNTNFVSSNSVVYFGVRNGLGYHFDDIFLHIVEHHYFSGQVDCCRRIARSLYAHDVLKAGIIENNRSGFDSQCPSYLKLTDREFQEGNSSRPPFINSNIRIIIPTKNEFMDMLQEFQSLYPGPLEIDNNLRRSNKIVIVGNDTSGQKRANINSFHDAADTWAKGKNYRLATPRGKEAKSGIEIINLLKQEGSPNNPITQVYFSTHGVPYAIDLNNSMNNLYTSPNHMRSH